MARQTICFTNVGASVINNYRRTLDAAEADHFKTRLARLGAAFTPRDLEQKGHTAPGRELVELLTDWARSTDPCMASAECNSTALIAQRSERAREPIAQIYLFATDTIDGMLAARVVRELLIVAVPGARVDVERIAGLQVRNANDFLRYGLPEYVKKLYQLLENAPPETFRRVFNPTGGFKSVVPYLTMIAMLEGAQTQYLFEGSSELIELQPLPIAIDDAVVQAALPLLARAHELGSLSLLEIEDELALGVPFHQSPHASLWEREEGQYFASGLGEIIYRRSYKRRDPIVLSSAARRDLDTFDPDTRRTILQAFDRMSQPYQRAAGVHEKYEVRKTDCRCFGSSSGPRIFFQEFDVDGGLEVRVTRIFPITQHDTKERLINTEGIHFKNFDGWQPYAI
ncbi:MAG: putative CRISPR-associated protein [Bradymonadaceae bacterium]